MTCAGSDFGSVCKTCILTLASAVCINKTRGVGFVSDSCRIAVQCSAYVGIWQPLVLQSGCNVIYGQTSEPTLWSLSPHFDIRTGSAFDPTLAFGVSWSYIHVNPPCRTLAHSLTPALCRFLKAVGRGQNRLPWSCGKQILGSREALFV